MNILKWYAAFVLRKHLFYSFDNEMYLTIYVLCIQIARRKFASLVMFKIFSNVVRTIQPYNDFNLFSSEIFWDPFRII